MIQQNNTKAINQKPLCNKLEQNLNFLRIDNGISFPRFNTNLNTNIVKPPGYPRYRIKNVIHNTYVRASGCWSGARAISRTFRFHLSESMLFRVKFQGTFFCDTWKGKAVEVEVEVNETRFRICHWRNSKINLLPLFH